MIRLNGTGLLFERFPNGELRVLSQQIRSRASIGLQDRIDFRYENDADLMSLLFVKRHLDSLGVNEIALRIEYMPYSRMDRSEGDSVFTLRYVTSFINNLCFDRVYVLEPHSDVTAALLDRVEVVPGAPFLLDKAIRYANFTETDYIVYPDAGAQKRYAKNGGRHGELVCYKHRNFATGRIERLDLVGTVDKPGFTAIIVDDLCSYGGTFVMTAERLRAAGAARVFLCVTHCENSIFKGKLFDKPYLIDGIFTINSILSEPDPTGLIHVYDTSHFWPNN